MLRRARAGLAAVCLLGPALPGLAQDQPAERGVVAERDVNVQGDLTIGLTPQEVQAAIKGAATETITKLAGDLRVTDSAVQTFLIILGEERVPLEALTAKLVEIAERHKALLAQLGTLRDDDPDVQALKDQARAAIEEGDYDRAETLLTEAEDIDLAAATRLAEEADARFLAAAATRAERGELALTRLDYPTAAAHFEQAADRVPQSSPLVRADYLNSHAGAARDAGDYPTAEIALKEALELREANLGPDDPDLATSLNNLALLYNDRDRYAEAEPLYERAIAIVKESLPWDHPYNMWGAAHYAGLLRKLGRDDEAAEWQARADAIRAAREDAAAGTD